MAYRKNSGPMRSVKLPVLVAPVLGICIAMAVGGCSDDCPTGANGDSGLILPDGSGAHPTIQAAIDVAADGDTVRLADGIFRGDGNRDLDFGGKDLVLCSASGNPAMCVIDCEGSSESPHRGFLFHSGETLASVVEGITITNGYTASSGGCIRVDNRSGVTLRNLVVSRGTADQGGALSCEHDSSVEIDDCLFEDNEADLGGAVACLDYSGTISGCHFRANTARVGGALAVVRESEPLHPIEACVFETNLGAWGGAVFAGQTSSVFTDCIFHHNTAGNGGAMHGESASPVLIGCTSYSNVALFGGGMYDEIRGGAPRFENCTVCYDASPSGQAAFNLGGTGSARFTKCIIAHCVGGPALAYSEDNVPELTCCDLYDNDGGDWTGAIAGQLGVDGNISAFPVFCGGRVADFRLRPGSPCTEGESECGQMGAWGEGCE